MLKENLASEQHQVMEISQRMKEAHEKEMHAHQQLNELQAIDRDHDYWPKVMRGKDEVSVYFLLLRDCYLCNSTSSLFCGCRT